ncbi:UvrD-helicase domain-containing protein [Zymomonas sp.]|uniref:UvrD-helicase domain-containing protein n=1 Tax=Zymomonas sp. TaxID=2068624 RepID=UPI0025E76DA4|nr:UvrD-helicase domain-containing protein [Zymomonas sp.]MCA1956604.1 UvrD-helicase domain-containing protein [Zymomonas sp.]
MKRFWADLHVHSRFARATSRNLDLEHLALGSAEKGIQLVATGDCTHPTWRQEMKERLYAEGNGLFRLKPEIEEPLMATLPSGCQKKVRFIISGEISTIYKKGDKTRKVHHLVYHSSFDAVDRFAEKLAKIGNIVSDGRPILGLDSRDLLEITLESGKDSWLAPAHIWTPWFSALGSKSGFDSIEECYGDLANHIFAAETGLSSDPEMNWRVSSLDRYRLISSSDAHSPAKLGREATLFSCEMGFQPLRHALETGEGYVGTVEFFPEEGKYHADGHRNCHIRLNPKETLALDGLCPVCGKPLTIGVAHRVEMLADREEAIPPATAGEVSSLIPLPEILGELLGVGSTSRKVAERYAESLRVLGSEMAILHHVPLEEMQTIHPLLEEAIRRLRAGKVIRQAGYDGEYGVIRLFEKEEMEKLTKGGLLFPVTEMAKPSRHPIIKMSSPSDDNHAFQASPNLPNTNREETARDIPDYPMLSTLDSDQKAAALITDKALMVLAGPGSGKTKMLTQRIAHLIQEKAISAEKCLLLTFTRRATDELKARVKQILPETENQPIIHSFHSLALDMLKKDSNAFGLADDFRIVDPQSLKKAFMEVANLSSQRADNALERFSLLKRLGEVGDLEEEILRQSLENLKQDNHWLDFDDLLIKAVHGLENNASLREKWVTAFSFISVDEFQDIDIWQYRLVWLLTGKHTQLTVIGDPDQAIYHFRGADSECFTRLQQDFPEIVCCHLNRNYRSMADIVTAANRVMPDNKGQAMREQGDKILFYPASDEVDEARFVVQKIEELMGGHDMLTAQNGKNTAKSQRTAFSFRDFAVLYRHNFQAKAFEKAFNQAGIPVRKTAPIAITRHPAIKAFIDKIEESPQEALQDRLIALENIATELAQENQGEEAVLSPADREQAYSWLKIIAEKAGQQSHAFFLEQIALANEVDFHDQRGDRVSLMTMHASKGLEFPVVFVTGLEEENFNLHHQSDNPAEEAEEKRLFYVALTRARDYLFLSHAKKRFIYGEYQKQTSAAFLDLLKGLFVTKAPKKPLFNDRKAQYSLF